MRNKNLTIHFLPVEESRHSEEAFKHLVEPVAVADFRILTLMLSPAVMIMMNTEVLSASSATRMDIL